MKTEDYDKFVEENSTMHTMVFFDIFGVETVFSKKCKDGKMFAADLSLSREDVDTLHEELLLEMIQTVEEKIQSVVDRHEASL